MVIIIQGEPKTGTIAIRVLSAAMTAGEPIDAANKCYCYFIVILEVFYHGS